MLGEEEKMGQEDTWKKYTASMPTAHHRQKDRRAGSTVLDPMANTWGLEVEQE